MANLYRDVLLDVPHDVGSYEEATTTIYLSPKSAFPASVCSEFQCLSPQVDVTLRQCYTLLRLND